MVVFVVVVVLVVVCGSSGGGRRIIIAVVFSMRLACPVFSVSVFSVTGVYRVRVRHMCPRIALYIAMYGSAYSVSVYTNVVTLCTVPGVYRLYNTGAGTGTVPCTSSGTVTFCA